MMTDLRHLKDVIGWAHSHEHQEHEDSTPTLVQTEQELFDFHQYPTAEDDDGEQHGGGGVCDDEAEQEADVGEDSTQ